MFIVDIIIVIFLLLGFLLGFRHGFLRELVSLAGLIIISIISFLLKNPISVFFYKNFPFFKFDFIIKGGSVINILLYEIVAFLIIFGILFVILKIVLQVTSLFEKVLTFTVILSLPSKILGGIIGVLKHYLLVFIVLFILSLPVFSSKIDKTNIGKFILNDTPLLSDTTKKSVKVFNEFSDLVIDYKNNKNVDNFNQEALDLLIKYKTITKENAADLIESGKLKGVEVK